MAENILYLCPKDALYVPPDPAGVVDALLQEAFIAETIEVDGETRYRPGEEFLSLLTFLGCSPVIAMGEPGKTGDEFCHIAIEGPLQRPRFVTGVNIKVPRCPSCGHRFDDWQATIHRWEAQSGNAEITCPECNTSLDITRLRWRKCAGFGRFFIKVWGIFESEAVPNPNLLQVLERHGGCAWQHFYIRR